MTSQIRSLKTSVSPLPALGILFIGSRVRRQLPSGCVVSLKLQLSHKPTAHFIDHALQQRRLSDSKRVLPQRRGAHRAVVDSASAHALAEQQAAHSAVAPKDPRHQEQAQRWSHQIRST